MNWGDERYVRIYTRDTTDWAIMCWEARALLVFILRKVDRIGVLDLGSRGLASGGWRGLAELLRMPEEVVRRALPVLIEDGCVELQNGDRSLVVRNFIEAQEASQSGTVRQQESRLRRRDMIRAGLDPDQRETVIYFIQSEHGGPIKIGRADDLAKRLVGLQTSRPDKLVVLAAAQGSLACEKALHHRFSQYREKGEWFSASPELLEMVKDVIARGSMAFADSGHNTRDASQTVTGHSVPDRSVPDRSDPEDIAAARATAKTSPAEGLQLVLGTGAAAPSAPKPCCSPPGDPGNRVLAVEARFCELHRARLGLPYQHHHARDRRFLKRLPTEYDSARLLGALQRFFDEPDPFVFDTRGPTIPAFAEKVTVLLKAPTLPPTRAPTNGRRRGYSPAELRAMSLAEEKP
jgi:hypothetical protein